MSLKPVHLALALFVIAIWGFNFVVIKVAVGEVPPLLLTALRFVFSAFPVIFFVRRPKSALKWIVAYGVALGILKFGLLFSAMKLGLAASLSSLLLQMQAFFTIAFAALMLGERAQPVQLAGAGIALAGLAFIAGEHWAGTEVLPLLMCLAAAAFWGVANVIAKKSGETDMLAFTVWACLVPPLPLIALSLLLEPHDAIWATLTAPSLTTAAAVAYLAWPVTIFGFAVWNALIQRYSAATVAPFSLLVPVFGITSGMMVLGEPFSHAEMTGSLLIFAGLCVNVFGPRVISARTRSRPA